ncbi:AAA family ATPase [Geodermatophilus sp. SYSU D00691]
MAGGDVVLSFPPTLAGSARSLRAALEIEGLTVWSSAEDVPLGVSIRDAIEAAVTRASALVVLYETPELGEWQQAELAAVLPRTRVIPCATAPGVPTPPDLAEYRSLRLDTPASAERIAQQITQAVASAPVTEPGEPPSGLVDALRLGTCVLAVGNAPLAPEQSSRADLAGRLLEWAASSGHVDSRREVSLRLGLRRGEVDLVLDTISAAVVPDDLERVVSDFIPAHSAPSPDYAVLGQLPFASVVTLRHDDVSEELFASRLRTQSQEARDISRLTGGQELSALALGDVEGRRLLACGTADGRLLLVDLGNGTMRTVAAGLSPPTRLAFGQLGARPALASGHENGAVGRWNPLTFEPLGRSPAKGHSKQVSALAFGSFESEPVLASAAVDGSVNVWRLGRTYPSRAAVLSGPVTALGFRLGGLPDGPLPAGADAVVALSEGRLTLAVPAAGRDSPQRQHTVERAVPVSEPVAFVERNGRSLLLGADLGGWALQTVELDTGEHGVFWEQAIFWPGADARISALATSCSSDGSWAAVGFTDGSVHVFDLASSESWEVQAQTGGDRPAGSVRGLAVSADGREVIVARDDGTVVQGGRKRVSVELTPAEAEQVLDAHAQGEFFVLHLLGSPRRPGSLLLTTAQFAGVYSRNRDFARFMQGLIRTTSLFFVGTDLHEIEDLLSVVGGTTDPADVPVRHFALVEVTDPGWEPRADALRRRFGVHVLPYSPGRDRGFLEALAREVRSAPLTGPTATLLGRLTLVDVGPFRELELTFRPGVNVLLGDNGAGKSTVLRAIAGALTGEASRPWVERILRAGQTSGSIQLDLGPSTVHAELYRTSAGGELSVTPVAPLSTVRWLALGFPAARGFRWGRMDTLPVDPRRGRAQETDLLPLVTGEPDARPDQLKRLLFDLDHERTRRQAAKQSTGDVDLLVGDIFRVLGRVTGGLDIRLERIDLETQQILVATEDGVVPLEALSQGTASLLGWLGVLVQRMHDVHGATWSQPLNAPALALVDEVDAHLHPAWQQDLLPALVELFPQVQFIVTTHSPLVVTGLSVDQVTRLERRPGGPSVVEVEEDMTMGRADQVLTSPLFGLSSTLDQATESLLGRYGELLAMDDRSAAQQREFEELAAQLRFRIPLPYETPAERRADELVHSLLRLNFGKRHPDVQARLLEAARRLLKEASRS